MKDDGIDNTHAIPFHSVKRIMDRHCPHHISTEAVLTLRDLLEEIASKVTIESVRRFENLNKCREGQGLRPLKRLNAWAVRAVMDSKNSKSNKEFINGLKNKNKGLQPEGIVIPGSDNMSAQTNTANARQKTTDDQREVV